MHKKILAICAALVALGALAIPAAASAAVTLREAGTTVPTGTKILATNDEEGIFKAGELSVVCNENTMTSTIVKNNGTTVEGTIESAKFQGTQPETRCDGGPLDGPTRVTIPALTNEGGTGHWCIKTITNEDKFEVIGANCGTASGILTFVLDGTIFCTYARSASIMGTFTTTTGAAATTLSVTGEPVFTKEAGSFLCPAEGKISKMKFTLSTDNEAKRQLQMDDSS
jgi:hypothetical protein